MVAQGQPNIKDSKMKRSYGFALVCGMAAAFAGAFAANARVGIDSENPCSTCWSTYQTCVRRTGNIFQCAVARDDCLYNNGCVIP